MTLCISTGAKQIFHRLCRECMSLYTCIVFQSFYDNCSNLFCTGVKIITASMESKIERARKWYIYNLNPNQNTG